MGWTEIRKARQERGALSPFKLLWVSLSRLLLKGLRVPAASRGRSCKKSVTFAKMSLQAVSGAGTRENNAVVCEALRCLCSVPAQLPEPERDLSPAAVTFVSGNMARPGFGQDKMLFLREGGGGKQKKKKSLA